MPDITHDLTVATYPDAHFMTRIENEKLMGLAHAFLPIITSFSPTYTHLAIPALAVALAASASPLPGTGVCECGQVLLDDQNPQVEHELGELTYAAALRPGSMTCHEAMPAWSGDGDHIDQHTIALSCLHCGRLYDGNNVAITYS